MNNTTKAKVDLAKRMISGRIPVEDVVMMSGLSTEEVQKIKDEFEKLMGPELDNTDFGPLVDNYVTDEEQETFDAIKKQVNDELDEKLSK